MLDSVLTVYRQKKHRDVDSWHRYRERICVYPHMRPSDHISSCLCSCSLSLCLKLYLFQTLCTLFATILYHKKQEAGVEC